MNTFTVVARIGKRTARYTVRAADEAHARTHVKRDVTENFGPRESVMFLGVGISR